MGQRTHTNYLYHVIVMHINVQFVYNVYQKQKQRHFASQFMVNLKYILLDQTHTHINAVATHQNCSSKYEHNRPNI